MESSQQFLLGADDHDGGFDHVVVEGLHLVELKGLLVRLGVVDHLDVHGLQLLELEGRLL